MTPKHAIKILTEYKERIKIAPKTTNLVAMTVEALDTVLAEIERLKADLYSANTIIDDLVGGKEITLREGLELIQKECFGKGANCTKCKVYDICRCDLEDIPSRWDIDNIIQAVDKLKEENNE